MTYILKYQFVPDYINLREPHRMDHFNYIKEYIDQGNLFLGGATESDPPEGILIFNCMEKVDIQKFAKHDPYVINGIVDSHQIIKWNAVAGSMIDHLKTN